MHDRLKVASRLRASQPLAIGRSGRALACFTPANSSARALWPVRAKRDASRVALRLEGVWEAQNVHTWNRSRSVVVKNATDSDRSTTSHRQCTVVFRPQGKISMFFARRAAAPRNRLPPVDRQRKLACIDAFLLYLEIGTRALGMLIGAWRGIEPPPSMDARSMAAERRSDPILQVRIHTDTHV